MFLSLLSWCINTQSSFLSPADADASVDADADADVEECWFACTFTFTCAGINFCEGILILF